MHQTIKKSNNKKCEDFFSIYDFKLLPLRKIKSNIHNPFSFVFLLIFFFKLMNIGISYLFQFITVSVLHLKKLKLMNFHIL